MRVLLAERLWIISASVGERRIAKTIIAAAAAHGKVRHDGESDDKRAEDEPKRHTQDTHEECWPRCDEQW